MNLKPPTRKDSKMEKESRVDWEKEAEATVTCLDCEGAGWTIGLKNGLRGEPEQEQVQCPKCYQGRIASYGDELIPRIAKALSAAFEKGREAR